MKIQTHFFRVEQFGFDFQKEKKHAIAINESE